MSYPKFRAALDAKRAEHTVDPRFEACDNLTYTLKRLGYVNRVIRATMAQELFLLMVYGKEELDKHRREMYGDQT